MYAVYNNFIDVICNEDAVHVSMHKVSSKACSFRSDRLGDFTF